MHAALLILYLTDTLPRGTRIGCAYMFLQTNLWSRALAAQKYTLDCAPHGIQTGNLLIEFSSH
uniref:Uncharacterized protein n=1 Tax=Anguilla anguilla TaxID=7936 RepID=A0A0E9U836_ANGAN